MQVTGMKATGKVQTFEVNLNPSDNPTIKDFALQPGTGAILDMPEKSLFSACEEKYGSLDGLGDVIVNGDEATFSTPLRNGDFITFVPKVEGGSL